MTDHDAIQVAEPPKKTAPRRRRRENARHKQQPRCHVILWNDEDHTFAYVIAMLMELFAHPAEKGYQLAKEVDSQGRAIVLTTTREHAELKRDQIHAYGKDREIDDCQGSMWATIEAAENEC